MLLFFKYSDSYFLIENGKIKNDQRPEKDKVQKV